MHIPTLKSEPYTSYFLNTFIPSIKGTKDSDKKISAYTLYFKKDFCTDPVVMELDTLLQTKYDFPPIECLVVFKHTYQQPIHVDGRLPARNASLNLPIYGFESTKMIWYKSKIELSPNVSDAHYFDPDNMDPIPDSVFEGTNDWVLVNTVIPHNIINVDFNKPKTTVCVRFENNPTFEQLQAKINNYLARGTGIEPVLTA